MPTPVTALSFGELLVDLVSPVADASLQETPSFLKAPGGAPANVAVGLARLGTRTGFIGQVGDDPFGHWLRSILVAEDVDTAGLFLSKAARTSLAFVATRVDGKKDICFYRNPGADGELAASDLTPPLFTGAKLFHCGSVSLSLEPCRTAQFAAVALAKAAGALISFDPNWRPSLWDDVELARALIWRMIPQSDIIKVADEEWEFVTGTKDFEAGAAKLRAHGAQLVVMTKGPEGAEYQCATASGSVAGFQAKAIDTLGAGDAFVAGLLHQILTRRALPDILNGPDLTAALTFANACGAIATQTAGAIPGLPTQPQVTAFIAAQ